MQQPTEHSYDTSPIVKVLDRLPRRLWQRSGAKPESLGQRFFRNRADDTLPLTVTHERIYILPSRRGWMFVASLLVMLIASINYSLSLGYALCFLLSGLFASALLATYRNLSGIAVTTVSAGQATAGDQLSWQLGFEAVHAHRGITLHTRDAKTDIDLSAGERRMVHHCVPAYKRGWQKLGRITLSSDYPVGLWRTWCYLHVPEQALVFPKPESNGPKLPTDATKGGDTTELPTHFKPTTASTGEFAGLRPYRAGDAINNIAWKAVARGQGLQSMEFNEVARLSPLTLDWDQTASAGATEARLSRLALWVRVAQRNDATWRLVLPGKALPLDSGTAHATNSLKALALHGAAEDPITSRGKTGRVIHRVGK